MSIKKARCTYREINLYTYNALCQLGLAVADSTRDDDLTFGRNHLLQVLDLFAIEAD